MCHLFVQEVLEKDTTHLQRVVSAFLRRAPHNNGWHIQLNLENGPSKPHLAKYAKH